MVDLNKRIAAWREIRGLTRQQLADKIGVTVAAVYQWEGSGNGNTTLPSHENLALIAKAFGVSMSEFWGDVPKRRRAS